MKIVTDKSVVKYGKIIFDGSTRSTHLSIGLSSSVVHCKDIPINIWFNHVFVEFVLNGAEFDEFTYINTTNHSDSVEVTKKWSSKISSEDAYDNEIIANIPKPSIAVKEKTTTKKSEERQTETAYSRKVLDLRIRVNNMSKIEPVWKVSQFNDDPLILDPSESAKMASLGKIGEEKYVRLSGSIWTDREGYNIDQAALTKIEEYNPISHFRLRIFKKMLDNILNKKKPLLIAQT